LIEFTGERVVPGQVDADLWNEHLSRYAFASRLAAGKRVLDAGCGSGYGSAELAQTARSVVALDVADDAVRSARESYSRANITYLQASCASLPLATRTLDLAVAFEVIEHIPDWQAFLREVQRVLAPGGVLVISTPNKDYYADTRRQTGPNPYHVHEFTFQEFASELRALFPEIALYTENHVEGIAFDRADSSAGGILELRSASCATDPATAHFFLAVCSAAPLPAPQPFLYVPSTANVLRERELHIDKLEIDVQRLRGEKQELVELFRAQKAELEQSNRWAAELDEKLAAAQARVVQLQDELAATSAGYEAKVADLEGENLTKTQWAQRLDTEVDQLRAQLHIVRSSRWVKVGNRLGVGPALDR
jgi:ubiquinone/menaquinone biosynthesis C-methylase UbiE